MVDDGTRVLISRIRLEQEIDHSVHLADEDGNQFDHWRQFLIVQDNEKELRIPWSSAGQSSHLFPGETWFGAKEETLYRIVLRRKVDDTSEGSAEPRYEVVQITKI